MPNIGSRIIYATENGGAAVASVAVAAAENAVVLIESKPIWTIGAGLAEGYAKSKLNAPHDLPYALDNPYFQLASDTWQHKILI